ncbi:hypothetical protein L3X38_033853 [Prunus dulcis]|uniref:Uncharacterized protein n=1 Tax=Prunus dulcis TaxID=3755 RepID=A0AAD4VGQ1_PRUDU|nr:hypothetical protein L3X38_033853 [Prunus dulcis]
MLYFASSRGPIIINDSILIDNDVGIGVARSLVTPRDVCVLGTRDDNREENKQLSDMVAVYSKDLQEQLKALEKPGSHDESFLFSNLGTPGDLPILGGG